MILRFRVEGLGFRGLGLRVHCGFLCKWVGSVPQPSPKKGTLTDSGLSHL